MDSVVLIIIVKKEKRGMTSEIRSKTTFQYFDI